MNDLRAPFMAALLFAFTGACATCGAASGSVLAPKVSTVRVYAGVLRKINPHLQQWQSRDLAAHVLANARRWKIDANLLVALVSVESRWRPRARSRVGALGLGQLMPGTAAILGVNPRNAHENLYGSAQYLSFLLTRYEFHPNRFALAFAAYNAGPNAVQRYGGVPPFSETQHYVVRVMRMWRHLAAVVHLPAVALPQAEQIASVALPVPSIQRVAPPSDSGTDVLIVPRL